MPDKPIADEEQTSGTPRRRTLPAWLASRENISRAVFLLGAPASYLMVEILNDNDPFNSLTAEQVVLNLIWYYLIYWVFRMIIGRKGIAAAVSSGFCFAFGLINHYVLNFRGRIIFPCDVLAIRTALNVAGGFSFRPDRIIWKAAAILGIYWLLIFLSHLLFHPRGRQKLHRWTIIGSSGLIAAFCGVFFFTGLLPAIGIYTQQWKTQANGFLLNFTTALRYSFVSAPEGYSAEKAQKIADSVANGSVSTMFSATRQPTNLIVVMNESFADLAASFPNLKLSADPLPFYHSLTKNTVKGMMISPVSGGGTANVEFEYLTGDSLAFLPSSTVAYQLYLYDGAPSLVSQVKKMGYHTIAFHPYLASGWNRTSVYPWLGFDAQHYEDDVKNPGYIRDYVSDISDYQQLYRWTDETGGKTFLFNVTIQNHSSYEQGWNNLKDTVSVNGVTGSNADLYSQYFSLIKESDNAIKKLVQHYSASREKTMIVFFGDHQPPLGNDFYQMLYKKPLDDRFPKEVMQEYGTPFFIWANYDIPEKAGMKISTNFFGTLTAELAGFPLTNWQKLHAELMNVLPVASTSGFFTSDGLTTDQESKLPAATQKLYEEYRIMAYNYLFDKKNHPSGFYDN